MKYIGAFLVICGIIYMSLSWFNGVKEASYNAGFQKAEEAHQIQAEENRKKTDELLKEIEELRKTTRTVTETKIKTVTEVIEREKFVVPQLKTDQELTDAVKKQFEDIAK
jgi:type I site-specific restriction endonuclease